MAVIATDNFNRADSATLGASWTTVPSNSDLRVVSNQVDGIFDPCFCAYTALAAPNDGECGVTIKSPLETTTDKGCGPGYRVSTAANTGYFAIAHSTGLQLYKVVASTYTPLGTDYTGTVSVGDVIAIRCVGTTITVRQNGTVRITATDSGIASGRGGAFGAYNTGFAMDDWYMDDLTVVTVASPSRIRKNTIHPGRHPDRFGKRLRTRRNNYYAGLGTITGTAAATNANDTSAATGTPVNKGSAAVTNANDTATGVGSAQGPQPSRLGKKSIHPGRGPYNPARFKKTPRNRASTLTTITGTASPTNGNDTSAATGTPVITGSVAKTNANDTSSATGTPIISGTATPTNANDTASASGTPKIAGSAAPTNGNDASSASGTPKITGTASPTNANDTANAVGGSIYGSAACVSGDDTAQARGTAGEGNSDALGGGAWYGTAGERRKKKRDDIEEILEEAEEVIETTREALQEDPTQSEARGLVRDIRAIRSQLAALHTQLEAARQTAIRNEIDRLTRAIESESLALLEAEIQDDNEAISLILGLAV